MSVPRARWVVYARDYALVVLFTPIYPSPARLDKALDSTPSKVKYRGSTPKGGTPKAGDVRAEPAQKLRRLIKPYVIA